MDKIICVGKNYVEHAKELGDAVPEKPVLFIKPPSVLRQAAPGETLELTIPIGFGDMHHECEIVVRLSRDLFRASEAEARAAISDVTLGLDMTLRELQTKLKKQGHPWEVSKVFRDSAVIGPWITLSDFKSYLDEPFTFSLDGKPKQTGRGTEMSFSPEKCVMHASEHFALKAGDLIFTGTPAGVGPIVAGQTGALAWGSRLRYQARWSVHAS